MTDYKFSRLKDVFDWEDSSWYEKTEQEINILANEKSRINFQELNILKPFFNNNRVFDVGFAECWIAMFMWDTAAEVFGCEINNPGNMLGKHGPYKFLTEQSNTNLRYCKFSQISDETIKKIDVFWVCVSKSVAEGVIGEGIIGRIMRVNPKATILHGTRRGCTHGHPAADELGHHWGCTCDYCANEKLQPAERPPDEHLNLSKLRFKIYSSNKEHLEFFNFIRSSTRIDLRHEKKRIPHYEK